MCVHWYFAEHFSELSCPFFSKSKGRILDELRVSFKYVYKYFMAMYLTLIAFIFIAGLFSKLKTRSHFEFVTLNHTMIYLNHNLSF